MNKIATIGLAGILALTSCSDSDNTPENPPSNAPTTINAQPQTQPYEIGDPIAAENGRHYELRIIRYEHDCRGRSVDEEHRFYVDQLAAPSLDRLMLRLESEEGPLTHEQYGRIMHELVAGRETVRINGSQRLGVTPVITPELIPQHDDNYGGFVDTLYAEGIIESRQE